MSMPLIPAKSSTQATPGMTKLEAYLLTKESKTYASYYDGKMSYALHGEAWETYVSEAMPGIKDQLTSENIFKTVIDLYGENLVPVPKELRGFGQCVPALLSRGECIVVVDSAGTPHFPEHFELLTDGKFTAAAIYTRSLEEMKDFVTFAYSNGKTRLFGKPIPEDWAPADKTNYQFIEEKSGNELFYFNLDDKGFGGTLAALQDRLNHSIIDLTVVAEMYARPFWYLLSTQLAPHNPFLPPALQADQEDAMKEVKTKGAASGRIFTTSSEGPFGQLEPPTITDMVTYHDSIIDKVSLATGIPQYYFKPGTGTPPTGIALMVLSKRFNNRVSRIRDDINDELERLAALLGVAKDGTEKIDGKDEKVYDFWAVDDDLLQEALDQHGINLSQMGYPLKYIAEVVTPGVDLDDYEEDVLPGQAPPPAGGTDMTAMGQPGLPATPGQVQSYAQNPGQRAKGA